MKDKNISQQGATLLLAVLVLAVVMVIIFNLAALTVTTSKVTTTMDTSTLAFYMASSGLEYDLYRLKVEKPTPAIIAPNAALMTDPKRGLAFNYRWDATVTNTLGTSGHLEQDETRQITLVDQAVDSATLTFNSWTPTDAGNIAWLEWKITSFDRGNNLDLSKATVKEGLCDRSCMANNLSLTFDHLLTKNYILRFKPLHGGTNYSFTFPNVTYPGVMTIKSTGWRLNTKRALSISFPAEAPINPLFDYVIFSGGTITK